MMSTLSINIVENSHIRLIEMKKKSLIETWLEFLCWISRYLTASLHSLTLAPPLRSGNAGLFTLLAHRSGEWWWEGPSGVTIPKHVHISTGFTAQALSPKKKNFLALRRQCYARGEAYQVEFLERPWKERESQNKDDRHNHQGKLSTWRRNSLATESHFLVRTERPLAVSELVEL